jgi:hypothetical protein
MADEFPEMQYRTLGLTGLKISVIGFGGWLTSQGSLADKGNFLIKEAHWCFYILQRRCQYANLVWL